MEISPFVLTNGMGVALVDRAPARARSRWRQWNSEPAQKKRVEGEHAGRPAWGSRELGLATAANCASPAKKAVLGAGCAMIAWRGKKKGAEK